MKSRKIYDFIFILLLAAVSFSVYINSLHGDFLIDDVEAILENERIQDIKVYFSKYFGLRRGILFDVACVFTWHFRGSNPFYYHLFNVLAHSISVILLFILCNILFNHRALSFLSGLIFAVHPIHTEAVSWISGGPYAFSSLFFIATFIFYIKSDNSIYNLVLSIIAFSFCLFAGNDAATLALMFIFYELFLREKVKLDISLERFRKIALFLMLLVSFIFIGIFFVTRNKFIHLIFHFQGLRYLIVAAKAFVYYLKILYLPLARGLYHPFAFNAVDVEKISPALFLAIAILFIAVISFFKCRQSLKPVSFGIIWFFVTYAPYSNIIPICNIISERYLYLASAGFCIITAALFLKVWELVNKNIAHRQVLRYLAIATITLFIGSYTLLTLKRNYEYNNIITYWESNINNFPQGYIVYNNLAGAFYKMGEFDNAIAYCWINLLINPKQPHVWYNLGKVYTDSGDFKNAVFCYKEALKINKEYFPAHKALAKIEEKLEEPEDININAKE